MRHSRLSSALLLASIAACSSGGDGGTDPGSISLALNPTSATIVQGASQAVSGTLTRAGGFTGNVNLTVTGQPTGVTATVSNVQTSGAVTSATITILVDVTTLPGVYPLVAHGTGSGVSEATANFQLTVDPLPPAYALIVNNNPTIVQGGSGPANIVMVRQNFAGNVTLALEGAPAGITGVFAPNPTSGSASTLTLSVAGSVAPNTYNMTVRGTSTLIDRTTVFAVTVTALPGFTLGITPPGGVTMVQGSTDASKTITITRTNYTLPITLTAEGLPAGVTASFAGNPVTLNVSLVTLAATGNATVGGPVNVIIRGTGPASFLRGPGAPAALEFTVVLTLTVTAAAPVPNFTLTTTPSGSASVTQGTTGQMTVNIVRTNGFAGGVTFTTTGLPAGITFAYSPNPSTAGSATLQVTVAGSVPVAQYPNIVIHGNATGLAEQTVTITINVTAPTGGGGNVTVDFSACAVADRPAWAASQNGTFAAPWVVVTGVNNVYSFTVDAGRGGFTYVVVSGAASEVIVHYMTQAEWTAGTIDFCGTPTTPSGRTLTGTVGGLATLDFARASFGGTTANAVGSNGGGFTMNNAGLGIRDLVIYSHPQTIVAITDRMLVDRDENPGTGFGTRHMTMDPFSFAPQSGVVTIPNNGVGETFTHSDTFYSRNTCDPAPLYFGMPVTGNQFNSYGATNPLPNERHGIGIQGSTGSGLYRTVFEYHNTIATRNISMGSQVPVGTTTETGTLYSILRNQYTAPTDFNTSFTWEYVQASAPKSATVTASYGYHAGVNIDMKIGQYTGLTGWLSSWAPQAGLHADTYASASGSTGTGGICAGAERFIISGRVGSF